MNAFLTSGASHCIDSQMLMRYLSAALMLFLLCPVETRGQESAPLVQKFCLDCHGATKPERGLNLSQLTWNPTTDGNFETWVKVFDHVQAKKMPPADAEQPSDAERTDFLKRLQPSLLAWNQRQQRERGRVSLRRLNRVEYENTLHDLLGVDVPLKQILPEDTPLDGFDTVADGLRLSPLHIEKYLEAADVALEAAIQLQPAPKPVNKKIFFKEQPGIRKNLAEEKSILRELDNGVVLFADASYIVTIKDIHLERAGEYRLKLKGWAFQSEKPVVLAMYGGDYRSGTKRMLAYFDMTPEKPREVEFVTRLEQGTYLYPAPVDVETAPDGKAVWGNGGKEYAGSGLALEWFEIEGPLVDSWPPPQTKKLFGDLPINFIKGQEKNQNSRATVYQVETNDPPADAERLLKAFAERAFRRPLQAGEIAEIVAVVQKELAAGSPFVEAVRVGYRAILTSPEFLHLEAQPGKLDDYALATRLSYFLWSTMPDEELLRLAREQKLSSPAVLREQTERMLADAKSEEFVKNFIGQWLDLRNIEATAPDMRLYPEFDELLKLSMVQESEAFFQELLQHDLSVVNIVDSSFAMLNRRLAQHYEIENIPGEQFRKVELKPEQHRGGVLTQAAVLKVTANGTVTSPVLRGAWVMKRILGEPPPPPPANVSTIEPDTRGATTIREQLAKHRSVESCAGCHKLMDPPGFALENYDVIGSWRERYRSIEKGERPTTKLRGRPIHEYKLGPPVDASGELADGRTFANLSDFKKLLLDRQEQIVRNLAERLLTYGTGASLQFADRDALEKMVQQSATQQHGFRSLIHEVVQSPVFQMK
jgi:Protein of unknown function (DUF1592)/Protein of unknown function (DUF1588)/Protein of unknown function (DUF1585)/Protein of unknown function (DUF1587)/Protein of unknown function (DUF1595)